MSSSTRQAVSGTPTSLFCEPTGATVGPAASNTCAIRSLVLVLPELPVTPMLTIPRARASRTMPRASQERAATESSARMCGTGASVTAMPTTPAAPAAAAAAA